LQKALRVYEPMGSRKKAGKAVHLLVHFAITLTRIFAYH
jgi:hypothetical protein